MVLDRSGLVDDAHAAAPELRHQLVTGQVKQRGGPPLLPGLPGAAVERTRDVRRGGLLLRALDVLGPGVGVMNESLPLARRAGEDCLRSSPARRANPNDYAKRLPRFKQIPAREGYLLHAPPPPGSSRWSEGFCTREALGWCRSLRSTGASPVGAKKLRVSDLRPHSGAEARAPPGQARWGREARRVSPVLCKSPRSTGASPVGAERGACCLWCKSPRSTGASPVGAMHAAGIRAGGPRSLLPCATAPEC